MIKRIKKLTAALISGALSVLLCVAAYAADTDSDEVELIAEYDSEVADNVGDYPVEFTVGFGTHTKMPEGAYAKLVLYAGVGCEIEGMDENDERIYGYSSLSNEKFLCRQSANGGYYPSYGETVRLKPFDTTCPFRAVLTISDKDGNVIHEKETRLYILNRDGIIVLSDVSFDDCEQKLQKPFYRVMIFLRSPLGTAVKILAFVLIVILAFGILERKRIKMYLRNKKALKKERLSAKGGNDDG
ncbi:MAG: hypothetical protein IJ740_04700 [Ruminococcus sp.]|nr:hypothetical protein [Ruminococcus sp.]